MIENVCFADALIYCLLFVILQQRNRTKSMSPAARGRVHFTNQTSTYALENNVYYIEHSNNESSKGLYVRTKKRDIDCPKPSM